MEYHGSVKIVWTPPAARQVVQKRTGPQKRPIPKEIRRAPRKGVTATGSGPRHNSPHDPDSLKQSGDRFYLRRWDSANWSSDGPYALGLSNREGRPERRPTRTTLPRIPSFCSKPFEAQRRSRFAFSTRGFTQHCSAGDTTITAAPSLNHPAEPVLSSRRAPAP